MTVYEHICNNYDHVLLLVKNGLTPITVLEKFEIYKTVQARLKAEDATACRCRTAVIRTESGKMKVSIASIYNAIELMETPIAE